MHFSAISVVRLKTISECKAAIYCIKEDFQNVAGGFKAWSSGSEYSLTRDAQQKIETIERKINRLREKNIKHQYNNFIKTNPTVTWEDYLKNNLYVESCEF